MTGLMSLKPAIHKGLGVFCDGFPSSLLSHRFAGNGTVSRSDCCASAARNLGVWLRDGRFPWPARLAAGSGDRQVFAPVA